MLNLIFQKAKAEDPGKVYVDSRWLFSQKKEDAWFQESFVKQVIDFVDKASVVDGCVLRSKEGKIIPPEYLSTGCKTAICVYEFPEYIFKLSLPNSTFCSSERLTMACKACFNCSVIKYLLYLLLFYINTCKKKTKYTLLFLMKLATCFKKQS